MSLFKVTKLNTTSTSSDQEDLYHTCDQHLKDSFNKLPLFKDVLDFSSIDEINDVATDFSLGLTDIVHIGVGGSSLGAQAILQLAGYGCVGFNSSGIRIHFLDNLDPESFEKLLAKLSPNTTGAIMVSKSGTTIDVIALSAIYAEWSIAHNYKHFVDKTIIITEPKSDQNENPIRQFAEQHQIKIFDHHPNIGGRYSALSVVGLFVAAVYNINIKALKLGAKSIMDDPHHAIEGAVDAYQFEQSGFSDTVLWSYLDRLKLFGAWYMQLWAESLGKNGMGTTPISCLGPVDQHSQQQLFIDGPKNKFITFLVKDQNGHGNKVESKHFDFGKLDYLKGKNIGDIVTAQQKATADTLAEFGVPVRYIEIKELNAETMGALMMHFMCETIATAALMKINPFDQPAVEHSKHLARKRL